MSDKIARPEKLSVPPPSPVSAPDNFPAPVPVELPPAEENYALLIASARNVLSALNGKIDAVEEVFRLRDDRNSWRAQAVAKEEENSRLRARITQLEASLEAAKGAGA